MTEGSAAPGQSDTLTPTLLEYIGSGRLAGTKIKLAKSWETREFLEIGLQLLRDDLIEYHGPDVNAEDRSRLFESLSRERILQRAKILHVNDPSKILTENMYRGRWEHKNKYTEDLISYLFRLYPLSARLDLIQAQVDKEAAGCSLGQLVRRVADTLVEMTLNDPLSRLQCVVQNALPRHPRVQKLAQEQYDLLLPRWAAVYEGVAEVYGRPLKPGLTWQDVASIISALTEGYLARACVSGASLMLSTGENVLAGGILTLIPAVTDGPPGRSLDDTYAVTD